MRTVGVSAMPWAALPWRDQRDLLQRLDDVTVGFSWRMLAREDGRRLAADLTSAPVRVHSIGSALLTPVDADDARLRRELDALRNAVDLAAEVGIPVVATTTGPAGHLTWEDALERRQHDLAGVIDQARACDVTITVENTHSLRSDVGFLHTLRDAVVAARRLGASVCADLYCCWAERGLAETLVDGADVIRIVQYADFVHGTLTQPNRWVPGDGDLPVDRLVAGVAASGFTGTHEIELVGPRIDEEGAEAAVRRGAEWLRDRLSVVERPAEQDRDARVAATLAALRGR